MHLAAAVGLLVIFTVPEVGRLGWTVFSAMDRKHMSRIVNTEAGAMSAVGIITTCPSRVHQVFR